MADDIKNDETLESVVSDSAPEETLEVAEEVTGAVETVDAPEAAEELVETAVEEAPAEEIAASAEEIVEDASEEVVELKAEEVPEVVAEPAPAEEPVKEMSKAEAAGAATAAAAAAAAAKKAEKARIAKEKASVKSAKKVEKKKAKLEQELKLKNECPREYKPVSTAKYFWLGVVSLCFQPVSFFITLALCMIPRNRNIKHFEQALFVYQIICIILLVAGIAIFYLILDPSVRESLIESGTKILSSFSFGI